MIIIDVIGVTLVKDDARGSSNDPEDRIVRYLGQKVYFPSVILSHRLKNGYTAVPHPFPHLLENDYIHVVDPLPLKTGFIMDFLLLLPYYPYGKPTT